MTGIEALSVKQTCLITGLGKTSVYKLLQTGELKARKWSGRTLILKSDVEDFLNNLEDYPVQNGGDNE